MQQKFKEALDYVLELEGEFSNHPDDSGGKTKYGITEELARAAGYEGKMKELTKQQAAEIYREYYWLNYNYDQLAPKAIAIEVFEQAVNCGPTTANRHLQQSYNLIVPPTEAIATDGVVGPSTLQAVNNCQYPQALLKLLNIFQGRYYIELVKQNQTYKKFIRGWLKRVTLSPTAANQSPAPAEDK